MPLAVGVYATKLCVLWRKLPFEYNNKYVRWRRERIEKKIEKQKKKNVDIYWKAITLRRKKQRNSRETRKKIELYVMIWCLFLNMLDFGASKILSK